jgi:hypothetical protein
VWGLLECRCERELTMGVGIFRDPVMRAAGTAGLGASPQSLVDNGLEGTRATAAFGATTETAVNLLGATGKIIRSTDGIADIVVSQDVAGTNNHKNGEPVCEVKPIRYSRARRDAKGKTVFSSNSKLIPIQTGMNLKCSWQRPEQLGMQVVRRIVSRFRRFPRRPLRSFRCPPLSLPRQSLAAPECRAVGLPSPLQTKWSPPSPTSAPLTYPKPSREDPLVTRRFCNRVIGRWQINVVIPTGIIAPVIVSTRAGALNCALQKRHAAATIRC